MNFEVAPDLSLHLLQPSDAEDLFEVVHANRGHLREWLPWLDRNKTPKDSRAFIASIQEQARSNLGFACGVYWQNSLAGMCGFHEIDWKHRTVVIGYWLAKDYQGNGIISRCTSFFISYAFDHFDLQKVFIPVAEGNTRSRAVCERLGLVSEGTSQKAEWLYDRWVNHVRYATDAQGWRELKQQTSSL